MVRLYDGDYGWIGKEHAYPTTIVSMLHRRAQTHILKQSEFDFEKRSDTDRSCQNASSLKSSQHRRLLTGVSDAAVPSFPTQSNGRTTLGDRRNLYLRRSMGYTRDVECVTCLVSRTRDVIQVGQDVVHVCCVS